MTRAAPTKRLLRDATIFAPLRESLLQAAQGAEMADYDWADVAAVACVLAGLARARRYLTVC